MDISTIQRFLTSVKANAANAISSTLGDIHVVLGNEAADLDSCISSIVTAFYLAHSQIKEKENKLDGQQSFVFPVINCAREDLPLRTEVIYTLQKHNINPQSLICRDEIDLVGLQSTGRLKLTLVDHNVLAQSDAFLQNSIVRVIDHHKRERPLDRRDIIEPVGSCCTLVAEMVLGLFDKDPLVCSLLYGTILLDTINLSPSAQKATPKDFKIIEDIENSLARALGTPPKRDEVYAPVNHARTDISQLTTDQLLRKDCKVLKTPEITIAVPAVPLLSLKFIELPGAVEALRNSLRFNRCTAIVLMGWEVDADGNMNRDVTVFSDAIHKAKQVCTPLENCAELQLQLLKSSTESQSIYWTYKQQNATLSRKFILPFLVTHFEAKAQNHLDVDALAGVEILIPNGEMSPNKLGNGQVPSISYSSVQSLGVGDPISHGGSNQSSAYNSCPYTPQNSTADPEDGYPEQYFLPSFNSREMIEKIELKRHKLRGYDKSEDQLNPSACSSYPYTPKNSFVESNMDTAFEQQRQQVGGVLHEIDSEVLLRKLMEKRKDNMNSNPNTHSNSNASSKSQSLTRLNVNDEAFLIGGDISLPVSPSQQLQSSDPFPETSEEK